MQEEIREALTAAKTFFERIIRPRDRATVIVFSDEAEVRAPFSNNVEQCEAENDRLRSRLAEAEALLEARRIVDRHPVVAAIDAFLRREP